MRKKSKETRFPGVYKVDDTTFRVRIRGIVNPKTGRRREIDRVVNAKNPADAYQQKCELEAKQREVEETPRRRLSDYATSWLTTRLPALKASTAAHYADVLDSHVLPALGDYFLDSITRDDLVQWRDAFKGVAPATVNARMRAFKTLLRDAVDDGHILRDPTRRLPALREVQVDRAPKSLTAEQLGKVLEAAKRSEPWWYPFFYVLAFTGMRLGEASALKWGDIDEDNGVIHIRRAQWRGIVDTPKNGLVRSVPLDAELLKVLRDHGERQLNDNLRRAKREKVTPIEDAVLQPDEWVFPARYRKPGMLMHSTAPRKPLATCLTAAGITQRFTPHGFRHTYNNLMRQVVHEGVVLRAMTGHGSEALTDRYSHVATGEKQKALGALVQLVSAARSPRDGGPRGGRRSRGASAADQKR